MSVPCAHRHLDEIALSAKFYEEVYKNTFHSLTVGYCVFKLLLAVDQRILSDVTNCWILSCEVTCNWLLVTVRIGMIS